MKNLIILLSLVSTFNLSAQNENSLLWKISGNGLEKPSYLFGTIHMIPKKDYFFTEQMQSVLNATDVLVIEADMFTMSLADKIKLASAAIFPDGKRLNNYLDSADYYEFKRLIVDSIGIKAKKFDKKYSRFKPFYLAAFLMKEYVGKIRTYEEELFKMSKKQGKSLRALETVEFQMNLVDNLTIEEQLGSISDMEDFRMYYELVEAYKQQDLSELYKLALIEYDIDSEFMKIFVNNRNHDWVPKIITMAKNESCFIAVGALHIVGKDGLISLLKKAGYEVSSVKAELN